jgi:hypothetical protein
MAQDKLMTQSEAAQALGIGRRTVIRYCQRYDELTVDGKVRLKALVAAIIHQQHHEARGYPLQRSRHSYAETWQGKPLGKKLHQDVERARRLARGVALGSRRNKNWRWDVLAYESAEQFQFDRISLDHSWKDWSVEKLQDYIDRFENQIGEMILFIEPMQKFLVKKRRKRNRQPSNTAIFPRAGAGVMCQ